MRFRVPGYYKQFTCIADRCIDNCCFGGWQIDIDKETIDFYDTVQGDFGDRLKKYVDKEAGCFTLNNGQCPFLLENNLCEIYKELGPEHMGLVCTQFPRFTEYYGNIKETGIGMACEEAARIILNDSTPFILEETDIDEEEIWGEYDSSLGQSLFILRDKIMSMLDDTSLSLSDKLCVILDKCDYLQNLINNNNYDEIRKFCSDVNLSEDIKASSLKQDTSTSIITSNDNSKPDNRVIKAINMKIWWAYLDLEPLNSQWQELSSNTYDYLYENSDEVCCTPYDNYLLEIYLTRLTKYYVYRYMLKASFDHNLTGKAQLIVSNLIILKDLFIFRKGKDSNQDDKKILMDIIHIFSREIEYSEDNISDLYDSFIFDDVFSCKSLTNAARGI